MQTLSVPIFPLHTVLFPGGPLPLRVFEPRYLDMVSHCMRTDSAFGVCLIQDGAEAGGPAVPHRIGTLAKIVDWNKLPEGLLGITALGGSRFSIDDTHVADNQLLQGMVTVLPEPAADEFPPELTILPRVLKQILSEAGPLYDSIERDFNDSNWVGYRLAEILPLDANVRQKLLEQEDSLQRLREIHASIEIYFEKDAGE